jgi:hypothetical protein
VCSSTTQLESGTPHEGHAPAVFSENSGYGMAQILDIIVGKAVVDLARQVGRD